MALRHKQYLLGLGVVALVVFLFLPLLAFAASNIDSIDRWAWNENLGWIDFQFAENPNVFVVGGEIRGYASSSIGFISLNCAYGPPGSDCSVEYRVSNTVGALAGWAWSDQIGWVSFCGNASGGSTWSGSTWACPASPTYQVVINNGQFAGWAWNDVVGWFSFCGNASGGSIWDGNTWVCPVSPTYGVQTTWGSGSVTGTLTSSIFDTEDTNGVAWNTIMWQGTLNGGNVKFQIASSESSSGPWNFVGPSGDGTYYGSGSGPDAQIPLKLADHNNKRYVRYKVFLDSNAAGTQSPIVNDVIIGYSP